MSAPTKVTADTAKLPLMLTALRLPTFANLWPAFADRADREGWPAARFLAALAELEWPSVTAAASSAISGRRACPWARRSKA